MDFGTVAQGKTASATFVLSNSGETDATSLTETGLAAPFQFLGGTYPGTGGTCSDTLPGESSCEMVVEYVPDIAPYTTISQSDTLVISYLGGATPTAEFPLTGVADYCSSQAAVSELTNGAGSAALTLGTPVSIGAQSFTPTSTMLLSDIAIPMFRTAAYAADKVVLRLRASANATPADTDLGTATVLGSAISTSWSTVTFRFDAPVSLKGGTTYWFLIDPGTNNTVQNDNNYLLYFKGSFTDSWAGGEYRIGTDGSTSWNTFSYDVNFATQSCQ